MELRSRLDELEIERHQLQNEVVRLQRERSPLGHLELLFETATELFDTEDFPAFVEGVFDRLALRMDLDGCLHYRSRESGDDTLELTVCSGLSVEQRESVRRLTVDELACGGELHEREPVILSDVQASTDPDAEIVRALGISAYACFPLVGPSGMHGTFSFFRREPPEFTESEITLLRFVSDLVGIAWARKWAERELRESEIRYRALADYSPDATLVTVGERIVYANRAAALLLDAPSAEDVKGRSVFDLIEPEFHDLVRDRIVRRVLRRSGEPRVECRWSRTDGSLVDVEISAARVAWHGDTAVQSVVREITDRKATERALEEARERAETERKAAEQASKAKSQFLAMMSHELRTPLSGAFGFIRLLEAEVLGPVNEEQRDAIARLETGLAHLAGIIEEILTFSRAEAGREKVTLTEVDLRTLVREIVENAEPRARSRGLSLKHGEEDGSAVARTDSGKIRQVVMNLLDNAIKYTPSGEIRVAVDGSHPEAVEIHVCDSGPGIAPEDRERIFEPFTQVDRPHTRQIRGTGLGLAICRRLAGLIGGKLTVRSALGEGSTFTLRVPRRRAPPGERAPPTGAA